MFDDFETFVRLFPHTTGLAAQVSCQRQGGKRNGGWRVLDKFSVKKGDFHQEPGNVLDLWVLNTRATTYKSQPCFCGRMSKGPLDGRKNMTFHLNESRLFVCLAADLHKILHRWHPLFRVFKLGSDPEGSATNKLVVFDVNNTAGNVSVDNIEGEVECFWAKTEGEMNFDQKVNKTGSHVPPNFRLLVHRLGGRHGIPLWRTKSVDGQGICEKKYRPPYRACNNEFHRDTLPPRKSLLGEGLEFELRAAVVESWQL